MLEHSDFGMLKTEEHASQPPDYFQVWPVNRCLLMDKTGDFPTKNCTRVGGPLAPHGKFPTTSQNFTRTRSSEVEIIFAKLSEWSCYLFSGLAYHWLN